MTSLTRSLAVPAAVVAAQYVRTPYGVARIVLPFEPRTDGIVVVQLPWATAYVSEDSVERSGTGGQR